MNINLNKLMILDQNITFLKETILLPDSAVLFRNEKILWTQELGLDGMKKRPLAFWGLDEFSVISKEYNFIAVPLVEWLDFQKKFLLGFDNNLSDLAIMKSNIHNNLELFEQEINYAMYNWNKDKNITCETLEKLFELYSLTDAYSILNYIIPKNNLQQILYSPDLKVFNYNIDDFLVSLVEPHRSLIRRKKLEIALSQYQEKTFLRKIYLKKYIYYDYFTEWLYFMDANTQEKLFLKDIKLIEDTYTKNEMKNELINIEQHRYDCIKNRDTALENILKVGTEKNSQQIINLHAQLEFLAHICFEEEQRHMIVCKFFYLMGSILNEYKIDVARTSIKEMLFTLDFLTNKNMNRMS